MIMTVSWLCGGGLNARLSLVIRWMAGSCAVCEHEHEHTGSMYSQLSLLAVLYSVQSETLRGYADALVETNLGQSISAMIGEGGRCSSTQQALDRIRRIH